MDIARAIEDESEPSITIFTHSLPEEAFKGKKATQYHELFFDHTSDPSLRDVAPFLNELEYMEFRKRTYIEGFANYYVYTFKNAANDAKIKIRVTRNLSVSILANLTFLSSMCEYKSRNVMTVTGSQKRPLKKPTWKLFYYYKLSIILKKDTSIAISNYKPLMFYSKCDFSKPLHKFIKNLLSAPYLQIPKSLETSFIYDYGENWINKTKEISNQSLDAFLKNTLGYLHLTLTQYSERDHFETIEIENQKYSILNGIYIAPTTKSVFTDNSEMIDGILMDTTWKVIHKYVTSILMCSSYNVGVSLAFAFGGSEDRDLYNMFIEKFKSIIGIDLTNYYVESDQGSALRSVCDKFKKTHLACLRHFKVSLKTQKYSFIVCNLISCRSKFDFDNLAKTYAKMLKEINDAKDLKQLLTKLNKVGLTYKDDEISIENIDVWNRVSMYSRISTRMPSTTNCLESTHGHLNEDIQRRNPFWPSLFRLVKSINQREHSFKSHLIHSYYRIQRNVLKRVRCGDRAEIQKEIAFYGSTSTQCMCGETTLESSMYRTILPCSHMIMCGAEFPPPPDVDLNIHPTCTNCTFEYTIVQRTNDPPNPDNNAKLKANAIKDIKRYSHYRNKLEIEQFVETNFDNGDGYANGKPMGYYSLTHKGIQVFSQKAKAKEEVSESSEI